MSGPEIITFGCRLNSFESEIMRDHAQAAGVGDLVVVHTCAVTAEAERQARQAIRRARRSHPRARIVVTGCSAQIRPEAYAAMAEVDHVVGNPDKLDARTWRELAHGPRVVVRDVMTVRETAGHLVDGFDGRTRGFVQVQNGCDHRCTFCIIPYGRGPSRSVPAGEVVEQTRRLVDAGYREVVLTGVDLTSYGKDLPGQPTIGQLVRRLLRLVPELPRLRLSSIDPAEVDPDLVDLVATEPRLMPHLHLSVQAGDDLILKRMKRRHGRADVVRLCADLRTLRPDIAFGADLIAGFPTETEAMFRADARADRRRGPDPSARLSLFGAARHACRAHAPVGQVGAPRAGRPPAHGGRAGHGALPRAPDRPHGADPGRSATGAGGARPLRRSGSRRMATPRCPARSSPRRRSASSVGS